MRRHIITLGLVATFGLAGCLSTPTPANCSATQAKLAGAQAAFTAASAAIPGLQQTVDTACANASKTSKACQDATIALTAGQALLPALQAAVASEQASVAAECKTSSLTPRPLSLVSNPGKA